MASKQELTNARDMVDLDVREVSLVDKPAILRQFIAIKRLEDTDMGAFETEFFPSDGASDQKTVAKGADGNETTSPEAATEVAADGTAAETTEVEKAGVSKEALATFKEWLGKAGKMKGAPTDAIKAVSALLDKPNVLGDKAGEKPEGKKEKTTKADEPEASGPQAAVQVFEDGTVVVAGNEVAKGRTFTQRRTDSLKDGISKLLTLLSDVDPESVGKIVESMGSTKELPKDPKVPSAVKPVATTKDEGGGETDLAAVITAAVGKSLEPLQESVKVVTDRVEAIENDGEEEGT